jgi:hypothetical protein
VPGAPAPLSLAEVGPAICQKLFFCQHLIRLLTLFCWHSWHSWQLCWPWIEQSKCVGPATQLNDLTSVQPPKNYTVHRQNSLCAVKPWLAINIVQKMYNLHEFFYTFWCFGTFGTLWPPNTLKVEHCWTSSKECIHFACSFWLLRASLSTLFKQTNLAIDFVKQWCIAQHVSREIATATLELDHFILWV